jgi:raffinose/stachyose/melibiose transport system substrate-binding protein
MMKKRIVSWCTIIATLCQKAGVDPTRIKEWDDFLQAVKKLKAAGITPIAAGGADKWPLHFYPAMLMMRVMGKSSLEAAVSKDSKTGLADPGVLKAWELYKELCDLQPFHNGYQAAKYPDVAGYFHDGKAAFHLMGTWDLTEGRTQSASKKASLTINLAGFSFPKLKMGKARPTISLPALMDG